MAESFPSLDIAGQWPKLNGQLIDLVDYVPEDKLDWTPKEGLFNLRGILLHIPLARHNWLANNIKDGEETPNVLAAQEKPAMQEQLRLSWERLGRFLSDQRKLDATYDVIYFDQPRTFSGHWIAYHLLEHDIHHRSDVFHYLALLGIEHPNVETP